MQTRISYLFKRLRKILSSVSSNAKTIVIIGPMFRLLIILIGLANLPSHGQDDNFWQILAEVHFVQQKDANGYTFEKPVFSAYLKTFKGKKVKLKGYMIPIEETGGKGKFMLSSLPFNVCYFCGAAGPETAVEVETNQSIRFSTKQIILEGTLLLNDSDPDHHIYILKSASVTPNL